jgi:hypothetical protein
MGPNFMDKKRQETLGDWSGHDRKKKWMPGYPYICGKQPLGDDLFWVVMWVMNLSSLMHLHQPETDF